MAEYTIEVFYLGHDNTIDLILKEDDEPVDLSTATAMTITVGSLTVSSTNLAADPIRWAQAGYASGEARFGLGSQAISAGTYSAPVVVYDISHPNGIVWGGVRLTAIAEVEA